MLHEEKCNFLQVGSPILLTPPPLQVNNTVTVSSGYTGPISSGQVSILTSGMNNSITQTIPIGNSIVHTPPPMLEPINATNSTSGIPGMGSSK